jgi:hypothetical protein
MEYAKSGWLFIDFVATFPFQLLISGAFITRLLRLMRLSKLVKVFDVSRIKRLIKNYFDKSNRADRVQTQQMVMYTYKIIRLILVAFVITYNIGCLWWLIVGLINTHEDIDNDKTFMREWSLDELYSNPKNVNPLCYKDNCKKYYKFDVYDTDKDGSIDLDEFTVALGAGVNTKQVILDPSNSIIKKDLSTKEMKKLFKKLDADKNGSLQRQEFLDFLSSENKDGLPE